MGNVHQVFQTDPWRSPHGAALEIRRGAEDAFRGAVPSYVTFSRGWRTIGESRVPSPRAFVCIQTGGKWGYSVELQEWLHAHAHHLHDARFYIQDEYVAYVEEYRIYGGRCTAQYVASPPSHLGLYLAAERPELMPFAIELLAAYLADSWFGSSEPDSIRTRALSVMTERAPDRWDTWYELGRMYLDDGWHADAVPVLERACALAPPERRPLAEVRLLDALVATDRARALELGRASRASWLAAAARKTRYHITHGLGVLADLERGHSEVDSAAVAIDALRIASDRDLARRLHNIARLRAAEGRRAEAIDWLRAAVLVDPAIATAAVDDGDLVPLHADLVRIFELARDLDG